jgi:hypothetical protein
MVEVQNEKRVVRDVYNWNRLGQEGKILATRVGLQFPAKVDYRDWERAGEQLARIADSSTWCLGDWLVYGQAEYSDRYQRAIEQAGLDYQTLRNYAWVARKFDGVRRRSRLSFQHHAEVAALPEAEQDRWLELAETHGWSRNQLRRYVREDRLRGEIPAPREVSEMSQMTVPVDHVSRWREAAERAGVRFEHWVVVTLNDAAGEVLEDISD